MLALDFSSLANGLSLLARVRDVVDAIKVGAQLYTGDKGVREAIREVQSFGLPVLVDMKILDVPHIVLRTVENLASAGASAVTLYSQCGAEVISQCSNRWPDLELFLISGLTSVSHDEAERQVLESLEIAEQAEISTLQVPGPYPDLVARVRDALGRNACLVACGMGAQGGEPGEAMSAGADYEIVGRAVYDSADPRRAAIDWRSEMLQRVARESAS